MCPSPTATASARSPTWSMHREDGVTDVPPSAIEASINLIVYYQRDGRRAAQEADRGPDLSAAGRRDRRRPAHRRRDPRFHVPDGDRRQRDHHQTACQRGVLGPQATPTSWPRSYADLGRVADCGSRRRCATTPPARSWPAPSSGSSPCTTPRSPPVTWCCCCSAPPHRDERVFDDPDAYADRSRASVRKLAEFRQRRALLPGRAPGTHGGDGWR